MNWKSSLSLILQPEKLKTENFAWNLHCGRSKKIFSLRLLYVQEFLSIFYSEQDVFNNQYKLI